LESLYRRRFREYRLLRLPFKFIGVEALENATEQERTENGVPSGTAPGLHRKREKKPVLLRWRRNPATGGWESNARLVQWNDGSWTLHIGGQVALEVSEERVQPCREHVLQGDPSGGVVYQGEVITHAKVNIDPTTVRKLLSGAKISSASLPLDAKKKDAGTGKALPQARPDINRTMLRERRVQVAALDRAPENEERTLLDLEAQRRKTQMRVDARRRRRGYVSAQSDLLAPRQLRNVSSAGDAHASVLSAERAQGISGESDSSRATSEDDDTLELLGDRNFGSRRRTSRNEDAELERLEAMLEDGQDTDVEVNASDSNHSRATDEDHNEERDESVASTRIPVESKAPAVLAASHEPNPDTAAAASPQKKMDTMTSETSAVLTADPSPVSNRRRMVISADEDDD
jgi:hypothetical protein